MFFNFYILCFLIFVSSHLMSYCNCVSAREGRCKCTFSALLSCSYLFTFVVAKYCHFERNKWRQRFHDAVSWRQLLKHSLLIVPPNDYAGIYKNQVICSTRHLHWVCDTGSPHSATDTQSTSSQLDSGTAACWSDRTKNLWHTGESEEQLDLTAAQTTYNIWI